MVLNKQHIKQNTQQIDSIILIVVEEPVVENESKPDVPWYDFKGEKMALGTLERNPQLLANWPGMDLGYLGTELEVIYEE